MSLGQLPFTSVTIEPGKGSSKSLVEEDVKADIERAMAGLSGEQRERVARKLKAQYEEALRNEEAQLAVSKVRLEAAKGLLEWIKSNPALTLERNDCSRLHKLKEAASKKLVIERTDGGMIHVLDIDSIAKVDQVFVVRHDWAGAFEKAEGIEDGVRLPYDMCAFEFRVAGRTIVALAVEDGGPKFTMFVETGECWYSFDSLAVDGSPLVDFIWSQIRAICIALDAEVATETVVRAPHKLNEKRAKSGQIPLVDYRIVDLARRHRVANPIGGHGGGRKRLHFRRGHWRHYETTKTWIRWCLVGNPDLGFIQKHYSL